MPRPKSIAIIASPNARIEDMRRVVFSEYHLHVVRPARAQVDSPLLASCVLCVLHNQTPSALRLGSFNALWTCAARPSRMLSWRKDSAANPWSDQVFEPKKPRDRLGAATTPLTRPFPSLAHHDASRGRENKVGRGPATQCASWTKTGRSSRLQSTLSPACPVPRSIRAARRLLFPLLFFGLPAGSPADCAAPISTGGPHMVARALLFLVQ